VKIAIITVSDTRTESDDDSGHAIKTLSQEAGHVVARKAIVKDDASEIQKALRDMLEDQTLDAIVINGGTGVSKRDVTVEAVEDFREKVLPGFGELFRMLSYSEIGSAAMMSRAEAFVTEGKVVFCLPGSEKAVRLAMTRLIMPELGHLIWEIRR
jgi:molybdenum cofactor biosynthesis protein B